MKLKYDKNKNLFWVRDVNKICTHYKFTETIDNTDNKVILYIRFYDIEEMNKYYPNNENDFHKIKFDEYGRVKITDFDKSKFTINLPNIPKYIECSKLTKVTSFQSETYIVHIDKLPTKTSTNS